MLWLSGLFWSGAACQQSQLAIGHSVEEERSGSHGRTVTSVVDTVPEGNRKIMDVAKLTWADVVRKPAVASNAKKIPMSLSKGNAGIRKRTKSVSVLKRSFSQNNPVNRIKV
jgi:hypothetical protein